MSDSEKKWTGNIHLGSKADIDVVLRQLCQAFNSSPYFGHNGMNMRVVDGEIECYVEMQPFMIGNVAFQILHGGVAATILDTVGGAMAMSELYKRGKPEDFELTLKKIARLATLDIRIDYLKPGRGKHFITHAEVLRMGSKSCVTRMSLVNDENVQIAVGIASYSY